jgi:hypothetical protein
MGVPVEPDHQLKVPVVRRPEYTLFLEQATRHHTFIHCTVHVRWTASVKRQLLQDWADLKRLHGGPIYALHTPGDRKHHHFINIFGFRRATSFTSKAGAPMEIYST